VLVPSICTRQQQQHLWQLRHPSWKYQYKCHGASICYLPGLLAHRALSSEQFATPLREGVEYYAQKGTQTEHKVVLRERTFDEPSNSMRALTCKTL
jgi:hypothetical protein